MTEHYTPPQYDEERLRQFYRRATDSKNLPLRFRPENTVNKSAFADAVIGLYLDTAEVTLHEDLEVSPPRTHDRKRELYHQKLSRAAFAIDFLRGEPLDELRDREDDRQAVMKEGVLNYALLVARSGAREVQHVVETAPQVDEADPEAKLQNEKPETPALEVLKKHEDLDDIIKRLYEKGRMKRFQAQSLLLLFELQVSTASPETRLTALYNSRSELYRKIMVAMRDGSKYEDGQFKDPRVSTGVGYLSLVVGNPLKRTSTPKLKDVVDKVYDEKQETEADKERVKSHVYSHVAFTLESLYP